jgi:energy-coupling factor transport system permease protein
MIRYIQGNGILHRAHPFTPFALAGAVVVLAFALPAPIGPLVLCSLMILLPIIEGVGVIARTAGLLALPFWIFLFGIHGWLGGDPLTALTVAARLTSLIFVFLTVVVSVHPGRFVDALVARGVPFSLVYLLSATLQAVPRLGLRAQTILEAQRCRGLRVRGSPLRRARALVPLAIPLVLGSLAEVDERSVALEVRGAGSTTRPTPLDPPPDTPYDRVARWGLAALVALALLLRIAL